FRDHRSRPPICRRPGNHSRFVPAHLRPSHEEAVGHPSAPQLPGTQRFPRLDTRQSAYTDLERRTILTPAMNLTFKSLHPSFVAEASLVDLRTVSDRDTLEQIRAGMDRYAILVFR